MKLKLLIISALCSTSFLLYSFGHAPGLYTGPLISPTASNCPPGKTCINPYLVVNQTKPNDVDQISLTSFNLIQYGLTNWLDFSVIVQGIYNHQKGINSAQLGDTTAKFGFQILRENVDGAEPNIRFGILESFPTGRFHKLKPANNGIDTDGSGAFETHFNLAISKEFFTFENHPFILRIYFDYFFNTFAHVSGFHAYGGGFNTEGKVRPPRILDIDFSLEYHLTEKWVYAMDIIYTHANASSFSGDPGTNADGSIATNTVPKAKQYSIAPGIEYNITADLGIVGGIWTSLTGSYFLSYIFELTYVF